mmetsp:Transcript_29805/g.58495  ORF Transcript_29805/g.58495 Transcript_29805/m.58495 type:complete len:81 (+) Transcript_29805:928-1170(+)
MLEERNEGRRRKGCGSSSPSAQHITSRHSDKMKRREEKKTGMHTKKHAESEERVDRKEPSPPALRFSAGYLHPFRPSLPV